ncbi:hypothetical protein RO3G_05165 [Rhizopus delemar RA 99-880]|uniref:Uncharacterized protein n=1 Tax=Rhizopus delemar (strain RA 99-880 / ATCC MYA-4621 / FGSC 9543 / NRRL 43880) TaxID=246409 RepID=I1BW80_RHIO9|nr:hypothetical protein RO3G_05165 [Rhizopus delemar RA 99-880]|eukprot:EIE80460.1 hypothetical protein RO3G_05165 [Rhizopus delemar RA 99-880]
MEEEILFKVASLINELASQQQNNQKAVSILSKQITEIKQKAETAKYSFNDTLPPATEQKDKVLEALKNRLEKALTEHREILKRNMELEKEKDELLKLIKDYEISLETVTSKLRTYANTTLEEQSQLKQEYSAVLEAEKRSQGYQQK